MKRKIEVPTYTKDIVGKIEQFDERDTIFAVHDLIRYFGEDSPASKEYFAVHPDEKKFYELQSQKLKLGSTGKEDIPFFSSQFWALHLISPNVFVDGESAPHPINLEPTRASEKIKDFAKFLGADLVGIAPLKQAWVYSHVGCSNGDHAGFYPRGTCIELTKHSNAIALGFHMDFNLRQA
jgi:hypothetical protein